MLPIQITMRDLPPSPALELQLRKHAEKLQRFYSRIVSCRIVIELEQKHKHQGKLYNVRIDVSVPKKELVVTRKYDQDINIVIRDAFAAIERQLEEHASKRHGKVKTHDQAMHGHVIKLLSEEGYGFIEGVDGHEYYFSITNVSHPDFTQFAVGDAVEFIAQTSNEGRQAHRVVKEKHNHTA